MHQAPHLPPGTTWLKHLGSGEGCDAHLVLLTGSRQAVFKQTRSLESAAALMRESRALNVALPCMPALIDAGTNQHGAWILQEYIAGKAWAELSHPVESAELVVYAKALAEALLTLERASIVHGDLHPRHVFSTGGALKLIDWSSAETPGPPLPRATGGTIPFAAPELIQGQTATPASDLYAAAACLVSLLAGPDLCPNPGSPATLTRLADHGLHPLARPWLDELDNTIAEPIAAALATSAADRPSAALWVESWETIS